MEFEWDPDKNDSNEAKHGISFLDALAVFDDPNVFVESTTKLEHGEFRFKAVGRIGERHFTIIFTDRPSARRIISVRRTRPNERRQYDQGKEAG
jgi:uncharacterized DUF497 family protein